MKLGSIDVAFIYERFCDCAERMQEAWDCSPLPLDEKDNPTVLANAMSQLVSVLSAIETPDAGEAASQIIGKSQDIHKLTEYGLQLLSDMSQSAAHLELPTDARELENLCLPLAVWSSRHGGEITLLAPVVNALAFHANHHNEPDAMQDLFILAGEIFEAVSPSISEDTDKADVMRPWRLLILNRAIVATRSLNPDLMEQAFKSIVEFLPEDVDRFFQEGMEQMDIIGYPQAVRDVMSHYYLTHAKSRVLH